MKEYKTIEIIINLSKPIPSNRFHSLMKHSCNLEKLSCSILESINYNLN